MQMTHAFTLTQIKLLECKAAFLQCSVALGSLRIAAQQQRMTEGMLHVGLVTAYYWCIILHVQSVIHSRMLNICTS